MDELQNAIITVIGVIQGASSDFFTSIWFPIQLGVIVLIALLGIGVSLLVRRRIDISEHTMGWPPRARLLVRAVVANIATLFLLPLPASSAPTWSRRHGRAGAI